MIDLKQLLLDLAKRDCIGCVTSAADYAAEVLSPFCEIKRLSGNSFYALLKGNGEKTVLFDAHIDQIGFIVTEVCDGFLRVDKVGNPDVRVLPSTPVNIHTKDGIKPGVFCNTPPHLKKEEGKAPDISEIFIDTLGDNSASAGDFVTFYDTPVSLLGNRVASRSLDNRAGVAALIFAAFMLKEKNLKNDIVFLFSDGEELGLRGAKTAAFGIDAACAVVTDVSFGDSPSSPKHKTSPLGSGAMIGISPVLSYEKSMALCKLAERENIPFTKEVVGGTTSTNADVISITNAGIPTALISIPLRNMHTASEVVDIADIEAVAKLFYYFALEEEK